MHKTTALLLLTIIFLTVKQLPAQQNEDKLWMTTKMVVHPEMAQDFESSFREIVRLFREQDYPNHWITFQSDDFTYYYFMEIESLGDFDRILEESNATWQNIDPSVLQNFLGTLKSYKRFTISSMNDYSYFPEEPRLTSDEMNYAIWDVHYIKSGKEKEYFESVKEFMEMVKSYEYGDPILFLRGGIGTDQPMFAGVLYGKNKIDFLQMNGNMWDSFGDKGKAMYDRFIPLLRERAMIEFWFRPDLSLSEE